MRMFWDMCHEWALYKDFRVLKSPSIYQKGFFIFMNSFRRQLVRVNLFRREGCRLQ